MPRKHISTACTACRERKTRCDGAYPRCGNCKLRAKQCLYQQGEDKRKLSVRKAIEVFSRRVSQLELFIQAHGLEVPPIERADDAVMTRSMMELLSASTGADSSNDDRVDDARPMPMPIATTEAIDPLLSTSTAQLANPVMPAPTQVLPPDDASRTFVHTDTEPSPGSASTPSDTYEMHDVGNGQAMAAATATATTDAIDLDGMSMTGFDMHSVDFPDWNIDFTQLSAAPHETTTFHGWDQLQRPYLVYPNTDFALPPVPSVIDNWRIPRWPQDQEAVDNMSSDNHGSDSDSDSDSSGDEAEDGVVSQVSDRMGLLHLSEDGELRYYGATSNLTLLDDTSPLDHHRHSADFGDGSGGGLEDSSSGSVRKRGRAMLDAAGVGHAVDPALAKHLSDLYFAWQDPSFHVVDKAVYEREQARYARGVDDSTFYSETLMNIICAFGALYDPRRQRDLPHPLSDFFMKRAKIWLEVELDRPRVATVQALVILSSFEAAQTRDARGWLYSGMSMRLSFDLGLHIDMTPYVASGRMKPEEAEVRKVAFWGSFIVDRLWGFYLGRPPFHINTDEVSVQKPAENVYASKRGEWVPYGLGKGVPVRALADPIELIARKWVLLCEIMGSYCHMLYDRHSVDDTSLRAFVQNTVSQLEAWKSDLPPELQVDLDHDGTLYLPHLLVLHMKYYQSLIYIHRPFISRHGSRSLSPKPATSSSSGPDKSYLDARRVCISSAMAISTLLRIYRTTCTLRYTNVEVVSIIFSAAIILVFASVASTTPFTMTSSSGSNPSSGGGVGAASGGGCGGTTIAAHLDTCCKALADLGHVFQNATRTLEVLLVIKRKWQAELLVGGGPSTAGSKRRISHSGTAAGGPRSSGAGGGSRRRKKRTMSHPQQQQQQGEGMFA